MALCGDQKMNLDSEEILDSEEMLAFAGDIAAKFLSWPLFSTVDPGLRNSNVLADRSGETVDQVDVFFGRLLVNLGHPPEKPPQKRSRSVQTPVILALGEHVRNVALLAEIGAGSREVTSE